MLGAVMKVNAPTFNSFNDTDRSIPALASLVVFSVPAAHLILSEPGSVVADILHLSEVLIAKQTCFQSYIMIVIDFSIVICDSNVREPECTIKRIDDDSHTAQCNT
jgi:hypothetical protein